ncbi:FUSC family protein [Actinomycetospora termitidis]|uniref:FUSC family protein n=1 Tax=Actinomycetospora termitidis TaxID=3053470 RepID=A0ABT7M328_9PSEU|nr:FUSC family protein [Actinomycetospora sp. Odt1-22]MDL5155070.1 FUSC family protein [Actinomycetospora sp. Odt1-22]
MSRIGTFLDSRRRRLRDAALPVLQCALAAGAAFAIARHVAGHELPFFAPIACVLVLGISVTNRLRRSVELALGVSVGVGVGDAIVLVIGSGWWQIAVVVALALLVALLFDVGALLLNQAAVSAVLVATLQPPGTTAAFSRWIDTLIGAALGLLVASVLPSNPLTAARRTVDALLAELEEALRGAAESIESADPETGARVLERIRASQRAVDAFEGAVDAGYEITRIAPGRRRHRGELSRLRTATDPLDLAVRNARVLVRRAVSAETDGEPVGDDVAPTLRALADAVGLLRVDLGGGHRLDGVEIAVLDVAARLPRGGGGFSADVVVAQMRSIVTDLLCATGMDREAARTAASASRR